MCVSRFNPTEPCCGDEPGCQLCADVNWERYTYAITFPRTQYQYGEQRFEFENGEPVVRDSVGFAHDVWLAATRSPLFHVGSRGCWWYSQTVYRGTWRIGTANIGSATSLPDYAAERSSLLGQWGEFQSQYGSDLPFVLNNLGFTLENGVLIQPPFSPGNWYFWTHHFRLNVLQQLKEVYGPFGVDLLFGTTFPNYWSILFAQSIWRGFQSGGLSQSYSFNDFLLSNVWLASRFFWFGFLNGVQLSTRRVLGQTLYEIRFRTGTEYEPIAKTDWRCHGPNVFRRVSNYTGPALPETVTVELIPKRDPPRFFHASRYDDALGQSGVHLMTQLPDT